MTDRQLGETVIRRDAGRHSELAVRVCRNDVNRDIQYSYQRFAAAAQGEYLMPFDCDDLFLPFDVDAALKRLDRHPEMAASCGKKRLFSEPGGDLGISHGGDPSPFALAFNPRRAEFKSPKDLFSVWSGTP